MLVGPPPFAIVPFKLTVAASTLFPTASEGPSVSIRPTPIASFAVVLTNLSTVLLFPNACPTDSILREM